MTLPGFHWIVLFCKGLPSAEFAAKIEAIKEALKSDSLERLKELARAEGGLVNGECSSLFPSRLVYVVGEPSAAVKRSACEPQCRQHALHSFGDGCLFSRCKALCSAQMSLAMFAQFSSTVFRKNDLSPSLVERRNGIVRFEVEILDNQGILK